MDPVQTVDLRRILTGWSAGSGSLHCQLADALRAAIDRGDLEAGDYLPSERTLADQLAVSRTTVVAALRELKGRGLVTGEQGRGNRVTVSGHTVRGTEWAGELYSAVVPEPYAADTMHLTSACLPPGTRLRQLLRAQPSLDVLADGHGYQPQGLPRLRQAIARHLADRGLETDAQQIIVTTGAQQALSLVACAFRPGSTAFTEALTYPGALDSLRRARLKVCGLAMDSKGARPDAVSALLRTHGPPAVMLLTPGVNNPTGALLPDARGREIVRLLAGTGTTLVEDCTLELLTEPSRRPRPLAAVARDLDVLTVGSISKAAWGGLRTGWVRCPTTAWADVLVRAKAVTDMGGSVLAQHLAVPVVEQVEDFAADVRASAAACLEAVRAEVADLLPEWEVLEPQGGLSCWVRTHLDNTDPLAQEAPRSRLTLAPESLFRANGGHGPHLRMPMIYATEAARDGVRRLAALAGRQPRS